MLSGMVANKVIKTFPVEVPVEVTVTTPAELTVAVATVKSEVFAEKVVPDG